MINVKQISQWQREASKRYHPDKVSTRYIEAFKVFNQSCFLVKAWIEKKGPVDPIEHYENIQSQNRDAWAKITAERRTRLDFLFKKYGMMSVEHCLDDAAFQKKKARATVKKFNRCMRKSLECSMELSDAADVHWTNVDELIEWSSHLKVMNSNRYTFKHYRLIKPTIRDVKNVQDITFGYAPPDMKLNSGKRLLIRTLHSAAFQRSKTLSKSIDVQRGLLDHSSKVINPVAWEIKNEKRLREIVEVQQCNDLRGYCKNVIELDIKRRRLNPLENGDDTRYTSTNSIVFSECVLEMCRKAHMFTMVSAQNYSNTIAYRIARNHFRAKTQRSRVSERSDNILVNGFVLEMLDRLFWAIKSQDRLEHPEYFSSNSQEKKSLSNATRDSCRIEYLSDLRYKLRSFNHDTFSDVRWFQVSIVQENSIGSKVVVVYWKYGTSYVTRVAPSFDMKRGMKRSLLEAEHSSSYKPQSEEDVADFWNNLQRIKSFTESGSITYPLLDIKSADKYLDSDASEYRKSKAPRPLIRLNNLGSFVEALDL